MILKFNRHNQIKQIITQLYSSRQGKQGTISLKVPPFSFDERLNNIYGFPLVQVGKQQLGIVAFPAPASINRVKS